MSTCTVTITNKDDEEIELEVDFDYNRACRGSRDRYGVPLEPDDPESIDINTVTLDGKDYPTTKEESERVEEAVWKYIESCRNDF